MSNQMTPAAQPQGQVATQRKPINSLKGILNANSVQEQFKNALGKNANSFIASIIDLYNSDSKLQECNPSQVVSEALKAAVLHLPINKALGYSYVIPFNNSKKDANGKWVKVLEPTFQIGYKGYLQLALRSGQYRTINADVVYEGEYRKVDKLTGEIAFDGEKKSDKVVGYFAYFEMLNGFKKTLFMSVEDIARHAKRYSKALKDTAYKKAPSFDDLMSLASQPVTDSNTVGWTGNFHGMATKTVLRILLAKYGYLSTEMQNAVVNDTEGDEGEIRDNNVSTFGNSQVLNPEDATFEEVYNQPTVQKEVNNTEIDPGY